MADRADSVRTKSAPPLTGLRVVEFANGPAGELTGLQFVHLGADVVKLEPPDGAPSRRIGPFAGGRVDPDSSLSHWYYNGGKRTVVVDTDSVVGSAWLEDQLAGVDVLIVEGHPAELRERGIVPADLAVAHPQLVIVSITPFGLTGPWSEYTSSDLVAMASSAVLILSGYDDHSLPPIRPGGNQALHTAASFAHQAAMLALIQRQRTGEGSLLDVSTQEAGAVTVEGANLYWFYPRAAVHRQTCRHAQPSPTQPAVFQCGDGGSVYFLLLIAEDKPWNALVGWLDSHGMAAGLNDADYAESSYRQKFFPHIQGIVEAFFLLLDAETAFHEGQTWGLPVGIMNTVDDMLTDEHFRVREVFRPVEQPGFGTVVHAASPYRYSNYETVGPAAAAHLESIRRA
jgi:crotonobetainyl-CoA:carnitine CoA-transferase CaiB-like acyl-CoA transferase